MPAAETSSCGPPCRLLVRSKKGLEVFTVPSSTTSTTSTTNADCATTNNDKQRAFVLQGATTLQATAPDGSAVYVHVVGKGIVKVDLTTPSSSSSNNNSTPSSQPFLENTLKVQMLHVSPQGTFLLTWERLYPDTCPCNLKVWEAATGRLVAAFAQKALSRSAWPYLYWTHDEHYAFLHTASEIRVYPVEHIWKNDAATTTTTEAPRYTAQLRIPGMTALSLPQTADKNNIANNNTTATTLGYYFTTFCPGTKDQPARASLHVYNPNATTNVPNPYPALHSKSLFQAEEMKTHWSPLNNAALLTLQTSVDASGQSYYGSSQLFLLSALQKDVIAVPLPNDGPVAEVAWMPNPHKPPCFVTIAGRMPSMAVLHHGTTGAPLFQFGHAHRNTVHWSKHGRFVLLAGFGNLAGGMGFWDVNKQKLLPHAPENLHGTLRAEAVVGHDWSPDSRLLVVSTCTPRMNVDNGLRLYTYGGVPVVEDLLPWDNAWYRPDQLYQAAFVPALLTVYPDRPQSPPPERMGDSSTAAAASAAPPAAAAARRYVPPSARNRAGGGTSLAERMRREKEGTVQGAAKVRPGSRAAAPVPVGRTVVGQAAPAAATKSKSALRREKLKAKKQQEQTAVAAATAVAVAVPPSTTTETTAAVDPEKRARKLKKILKQIDELKTRDAASLNDDQTKKIASEPEIRNELASLGV